MNKLNVVFEKRSFEICNIDNINETIKMISDIIAEEVSKIRKTLNITEDIELKVRVQDNYKTWGRMGRIVGCNELKGIYEISVKTLVAHKYGNKLNVNCMHELLHLVANDGMQHQGKWAIYKDIINKEYNYNIREVNSPEDFGCPTENLYRYVIRCPKCGVKQGFSTKEEAVINPHKFRCIHCKTNMVRFR